jgi:hypothetical protein
MRKSEMGDFIKKRLKMEDSATYIIRVQGCLEEVWSDRLANMTITMDLKDQKAPVSMLQGRIRDQSELVGVLNGLYQMRVPILSMDVLSEEIEIDNQSEL